MNNIICKRALYTVNGKNTDDDAP